MGMHYFETRKEAGKLQKKISGSRIRRTANGFVLEYRKSVPGTPDLEWAQVTNKQLAYFEAWDAWVDPGRPDAPRPA